MLVEVSDLKPGDKFIWADAYTRSFMIADKKRRTGVLELVEQRDGGIFVFRDPDDEPGRCREFYYDHSCYAYQLNNSGTQLRRHIDWDICCIRCGNRYGKHMGALCPEGEGIFMPDQEHARNPVDGDWFAVELEL